MGDPSSLEMARPGSANAGMAGPGKVPLVRDACGPASDFQYDVAKRLIGNHYRTPSEYQRFFAALSKSFIVSAALPGGSARRAPAIPCPPDSPATSRYVGKSDDGRQSEHHLRASWQPFPGRLPY